MFDLSQAYIRINIDTLCTKMKRTELPEQTRNLQVNPDTKCKGAKITGISEKNRIFLCGKKIILAQSDYRRFLSQK